MPSRLIDREPVIQTNGIQICCVGLPRTGTVSLYRALEILGYRTYHGLEFVANGKRDMDLLHEALLLKSTPQAYSRHDFDKIWPSYAALIDLPAFAFVPDLLKAYPDAKFILTNRSADLWLASMRKTVFAHLKSWPLFLQSLYDTQHAGPMRRLLQTWARGFCGDGASDEAVLRAFREHNDFCKNAIPAERLLVVDLDGKDAVGWEKVCKFLGKEIPKEAWPHANNRGEYADRSNRMRSMGFWKPLRNTVCAGGLFVVAGWGLYRFIKQS